MTFKEFKPPMAYRTCDVDGCLNKHECKGLCNKHYLRVLKGQNMLDSTVYDKRPAIIKGDIALIPLGVDAKDGYATVDVKFAYLADKYFWNFSNSGYATTRPTRLMHHFVIGKPPKGLVTDHINRNKLDNRLENLRHTTTVVNAHNIGLRKNNTSGYTGIRWDKNTSKWVALLRVNGKNVAVLRSTNVQDCVEAREKAVLAKLNGEG